MRPTREGKRFLLAALLILIAALNTGNNLIYLICGMMLSILTLSYLLLYINMRGLALSITSQGQAYAGGVSGLDITLANTKSSIPSYSINIAFPKGIESSAHMAYIPARGSVTLTSNAVFQRRGLYNFNEVTIQSGFPFIFFTRILALPTPGSVLVYPMLRDVHELVGSSRGEGEGLTERPGRGDELLSIREFRDGDDRKLIHWRASARAGELLVREFAEESPRRLTLLLDNSGEPLPDVFERAVSMAASLAVRYIEEGYHVRVLACSAGVQYGTGYGHRSVILDFLALISEEAVQDCPLEPDQEGIMIAVIKTRQSPAMKLARQCDMVIYAEDI